MANSYSTHIPPFLFLEISSPPLILCGPTAPPYSIMLHTHAEYNLPFAREGKALPANKGTEVIPSTADPCYNTVNCTPSSSYCVTKIKKTFPKFQETGH